MLKLTSQCHTRPLKVAASISLATAVFFTGSLQAQQQVLEEILVTAQKREQSLTDVPMSVQVLSGETFIEQGYNDLQDAAEIIPGLTVEQTEGQGVTVRIRGISNEGFNVAFEQATAVFNDGLYYGRSLQGIAGIYDIERMEVLFGPQPVYFGQSAIAGLIGYSSTRPTSEFDGYLLAEAGNIGHQKLEGAVTVPLSDTWGVRLSGKQTENDGWVDLYEGGNGNASTDDAYRFQIAGDITDRFSLWAKYEEFEQATTGFAQEGVACNPALSSVQPLTWCDNAIASDLAEWNYDRVTSAGGRVSIAPLGITPVGNLDLTQLPQAQIDALGVDITGSANALELVYEFENGVTLTSLTGASEYDSARAQDFDFTPYASLAIVNDETFEQTSQEFRIQSNSDDALNWMAGLYWQDQELGFGGDIIAALPNPMGPSGTNATEYVEEASYFGAFAAVTWEVTDTVTLDYGIRFNEVEKDAYLWEVDSFLMDNAGTRITNTGPANPVTGARATVVPNGTQPTAYSGLLSQMVAGDRCLGNTPNNDDCEAALLAGGVPAALIADWGDTDLALDEDDITQQIAVNWAYSDTSSAFIRYAEAFKPGGFSRGSSSFTVSTKGQYEAEVADSLEIGGRFGFADGRGRANLTLYTTNYENRQVQSQFDDPITGANVFLFINAADSSIDGFEADLTYLTEAGVTFKLGGNYVLGKFDTFDGASCTNAETQGGFCPTGVMDLSGTQFNGQPNWSITGSASYDIALSDNLNLSLSGDFTTYDDFDNTRPFIDQITGYEYQEQDGYTLLNVRAGIEPADGKWELALYGRNVTDELYWQTQPEAIGIFGTAQATVSRPATYGLSFRYNLGN